jgi:glucose/arabinose dehydrogenase
MRARSCPSSGWALLASVLLASTLVAEPVIRSERIAAGLDSPVFVTAPPGDPRLFVVERAGRIRIIADGSVLPAPFLDIAVRVSTAGAFGMFGLAFDPDYATTGSFYVYYVNHASESVISRFQVGADPNLALAASEEPVFSLFQPFTDHNGGTVAFGPHDGFLYFAPGDGGGGPYDPNETAQSPQQLLGKMLRLDVGGGVGTAASVPSSNPFVNDPAVADEIWAFGLRNPFRFSFDRETGDLWIADVGQENREEILYEPAGAAGGRNYGWDIMEGTLCVAAIGWDPSSAYPCNHPALALPLREYGHAAGDCSITGGYVYRGSIPEIRGLYFYGDYCSRRIWSFDRQSMANVDRTAELEPPGAATLDEIVGFGEDGFGELYVVDLAGEVFRVRSTAADGDDDVVPDAVDNCPAAPNRDQTDTDADGMGDACDCQPLDDAVWQVPGEVGGLRVSHSDLSGGTTTLTWDAPALPGAHAIGYDTVRSELAQEFAGPGASCLEAGDGADLQAVDTASLAPGARRFYLVRAVNACGPGSAGPRDVRDCP